ncbi:MAG: hypothetical protein ABI472_18895 [Ginsengibacter sp.]
MEEINRTICNLLSHGIWPGIDGKFADLMAAAISKQDITQLAAKEDIVLKK